MIGAAALEGWLCLGPDEPKGETTYVLTEEWLAPADGLPRDSALAELARCYLTGYGPADVRDFAAWAGLTLSVARKGWPPDGALVTMELEGKPLSMLRGESQPVRSASARKPVVNLLPAFDTYLLGYADRSQVVALEHQAQVYHGGQVVPVVLVDGLAAGVWRTERKGKRIEITARAFNTFEQTVIELIEAEAQDVGRFWGMPVDVKFA